MIKIVSGGQAGVDRAALVAARELGILIGGWCTKGGLDENHQRIPEFFRLKESASAFPETRTKLNVRDSDATLILVPSWPLPKNIVDGTILTIDEAIQQSKKYQIIDLSQNILPP